ncbi:hypothetical protein FisN_23Lh140 [Fistulifera solaris]|uniref:Uncharacterized protein n=1 Tax=Fistulifera solaris TaxID=1519565 RepID=A0A1Z5KMJ5_FISSO|nr:hypothetical protein FisN_23Lh140 [Fistulifera solaris]|eukprot:GAX27292.1 hypothetical protein FisN_23Lh140 [Fistulifera solaris]
MALRTILAYLLLFTHSSTAGPFGVSNNKQTSLLADSKTNVPQPSLHAPFSVVSTIVLTQRTNGADGILAPTTVSWDIQSGCMLVPNGDAREAPLWCGRAQWSPQSLPLWNTLALLSDLLVVVVESPDTTPDLPSDCILAFVDGLRQRVHAAGLPKGRLIILRNHLATPEEVAEWKEHLDTSLGLSSSLSTDLLQLFFVSSGNSFQEALKDTTWDAVQTQGVCAILRNDVEAFAPLLQRVFHSKGGLQEANVLEKQVSRSLFPPRLMKEIELTPFDLGVRESAMAALQIVQSTQEQACLDSEKNLLDFSSLVDPLLDDFAQNLNLLSSPQAQRVTEGQIRERVVHLYEKHLQSLRDYFGTMYEDLLDENLQKPAHWPEFARIVKSAFLERATDAVPQKARENGIFHYWQLDYSKASEGLLQDMTEITEFRRQDDEELLLGVEPEERRIPKWAEQLGARALMLGVNYLQGWLALQGLRQAALERERNLPKFPLF